MDKILEDKIYLLEEYFRMHPNTFDEMEEEFILNYTKKNRFYKELIPTLVRQVYDELGMLPKEDNIYIGFIKLVNDLFNIENSKIIEVGGGVLPRLGERIADVLNKGSITVYDPRISNYKKNSSKLKLVRKNFNSKIDVGSVDLLIGLMPCKAAEAIVEFSIKNNKDFIVALCEGGMHGEEDDYFEDDEEWRNSLIKTTKRRLENSECGKLKIKYMTEYYNPYPVIYNERI